MKLKERLPNGACFRLVYDAPTETWAGTLCMPDVPAFGGREHGLFKLCELLDGYYRTWRDENSGNVVDAAPEEATVGADAAKHE